MSVAPCVPLPKLKHISRKSSSSNCSRAAAALTAAAQQQQRSSSSSSSAAAEVDTEGIWIRPCRQQRRRHSLRRETLGLRGFFVKLSMKRILTVLSRRAIHEQCLLARRLLQQQQKREALELQRHETERQLLLLQQKIRLQQQQQQQGSSTSLACLAWQQQLEEAKARHEELLLQLQPLRLETQQLLAPDWRFERRSSDLPGPVSWRRERIPALRNKQKVFRF
ncbi:hypothetical protein Emed_000420 [Eimeria media]